MLSPETTELLINLQSRQNQYSPHSDELKAMLSDKTLVQLIGPTACGKSTVMDTAIGCITDLNIVGTGTTRQPREGDHQSRYHYLAHDDKGLGTLSRMIKNGEVVQYYVTSDPPHFVYWSEPRDYSSRLNIGDYFSGVIDSFTSYGFEKTIPISIVREVEPWLAAVDERFPVGSEHRVGRLKEAVSSIMWSLAQSEFQHSWLISREGDLEQTVDDLEKIIKGQRPDDKYAIELARNCLQEAQTMLERELHT